MTPLLTVNLLRVLFVTFCGFIGGAVSAELRDTAWPGIIVGVTFGLVIVLADRLLKGVSLRAFSSATFGAARSFFCEFADGFRCLAQAVGYLPDGTMIVVNHARAHLGHTAKIIVSSALQTAAGRLIFAELKSSGDARPNAA